MFFILSILLACDPNVKGSLDVDTGTSLTDTADDSVVDTDSLTQSQRLLVVELVPGASSAALSLHNLENWEDETFIDTVGLDSRLVASGEKIWLLERGQPNRISQYDPNDLSTPPIRYELPTGDSGYPTDVSLCGDRAFVTLYDSTDILVLNPEDLSEETRLDISQYADSDGLPEASSMVCKSGMLMVSLHRFNRNEIPGSTTPQQDGSLWLFYDSASLELITTKEEVGYLADIYNIVNTDYIGLVIRPHIDVSGTTGFWTYGLSEDIYYSQIYSAYNDMSINGAAFDTENAVHIARSWYDDSSMAFCHPLTPGVDLPNNMLPVNAPVDVNYHLVFMDDQGHGWVGFDRLLNGGSDIEFGLFPIDPTRCELHTNEISTAKRVLSALHLDK